GMIDRDRQENFHYGRAVVRQSGVAALCHFIPAVVCACVWRACSKPSTEKTPARRRCSKAIAQTPHRPAPRDALTLASGALTQTFPKATIRGHDRLMIMIPIERLKFGFPDARQYQSPLEIERFKTIYFPDSQQINKL